MFATFWHRFSSVKKKKKDTVILPQAAPQFLCLRALVRFLRAEVVLLSVLTGVLVLLGDQLLQVVFGYEALWHRFSSECKWNPEE